jgi:hypothetical protein
MPLPNNATLGQLAEEVGATPAEIADLPPAVRNLTKGELIDLWGAQDARGAISAYQQGQNKPLPAKAEGINLTLSDIATIQSIFSPTRVTPVIGGGLQPAGGVADAQAEEGGTTVNCCCCPCCCAATAIQPLKYL